MWKRTFVGVSMLLGESADDAAAALETVDAEAQALLDTQRAGSRAMRARALAGVAEDTLKALREQELR